jgi:hypothetical protein
MLDVSPHYFKQWRAGYIFYEPWKHQMMILLLALIFIFVAAHIDTVASSSLEDGQRNEEISIPVQMWDLQGRVVERDGNNNNYYIPRYLVGRISSRSPSCSSTPKNSHHFTFDLGNPGITTLLDPGCRGCDGVSNTTYPDFCPIPLPKCNSSNPCWPSRPTEFLPNSCFKYLPITGRCSSYGAKIIDAGTIHSKQVCMMCFDSGNHSRYFIPSTADDLIFLSADRRILEEDRVVYNLPSPFFFGALIRTVPLQDRIWSNVGIGYHSSFMNQTGFTSIQFSLRHTHHPKQLSRTSLNESYATHSIVNTESFLRFNPRPERYVNSSATQRYLTPHHRVHNLDGFSIGYSNFLINNDDVETHEISIEKRTQSKGETNTLDFIMDTGNGGICIADSLLKDRFASATRGQWKRIENDTFHTDNHTNTTEQLIINRFTPSNAPDLHVIFTPGIKITMKGYMWVTSLSGHTIFVTCELNVLGLPFMASGVELVFDDANKMLYMMGDNVHILRDEVLSFS